MLANVSSNSLIYFNVILFGYRSKNDLKLFNFSLMNRK